MRCNIFKAIACSAFCALPAFALPDTARLSVCAIDDATGRPVPNASVKIWFDVDIGWRAWSEPTPIVTADGMTDGRGLVRLTGETNTGHLSCRACKDGAYYRAYASQQYKRKNMLGVWQPDDLVVTLRLQRVESPVPLLVKRVEWRNWESGLRGLQGTNAVMRFDMVMGDWLPPYGHGEIADMTIASKVTVTGTGRLRKTYPGFGWTSMDFYEVRNDVALSDMDAISEVPVDSRGGIMVRKVASEPQGSVVSRTFKTRQVFERNGKDWYAERVTDLDPDCCYTFRIRTRRDGNGNLVEAYYGKIYGDFSFSGDLERGVTAIRFLYYLNPTPLDRNLEWDMRNNLCPDSGSLGERRP